LGYTAAGFLSFSFPGWIVVVWGLDFDSALLAIALGTIKNA